MAKFYSYQETSLNDLPHEEWKDIPGFEGYYQLSTHGRVKSLSRYILRCTQRVGFWTKDKIIAPYLSAGYNRFLDQYTYRIAIKLYKDNKAYPLSVARYVYALFVEEFDMDNPEHVITYRDGDSQNIHYTNLFLATQQQVHKICFARKRRLAPNVSTARSVTQYDLLGKKITTYDTVHAASLAIEHPVKRIYQAVGNPSRRLANCYWRYDDLPAIDVAAYTGKRRRNRKKKQITGNSLADIPTTLQVAATATTSGKPLVQPSSSGKKE